MAELESPVLRCIHRHTIKEHPSCFSKGKIKWSDQQKRDLLEAEFYKAKKPLWYVEQQSRIGYLDIESDGLKADFSTMLSWCIKVRGGDILEDVITKRELFNLKFDERIVRSLVNTMKMFDVIVTYYGTGFDIPFVRTKALRYGMDFPEYQDLAHWDLFYQVRSKLNLSRKSLDNATNYLGIEGKTPISKDVWRKAKYGDKDSLEEVLEHNRADVEITEMLHDKLFPFAKWIRRTI